ncbi:MAG: nitroreductase family protein, partial [Candidatus Bipolaricaulota bacterium]
METLEAIARRRSIRRFTREPIPREQVESLLRAATQAPSGKNLQPWRFVVLHGTAKDALVTGLRSAVRGVHSAGGDVGSSPWTVRIMRDAPVLVVVFSRPAPPDMKKWEDDAMRINLQSIGAAIQNLCLAATASGLGSLWIADVFYDQGGIEREFALPGERLVAAVAL